MEAEDIHRLVEDAFNAGHAEALVALYEDDAAMATPDGTSCAVELPFVNSGRASSPSVARSSW